MPKSSVRKFWYVVRDVAEDQVWCFRLGYNEAMYLGLFDWLMTLLWMILLYWLKTVWWPFLALLCKAQFKICIFKVMLTREMYISLRELITVSYVVVPGIACTCFRCQTTTVTQSGSSISCWYSTSGQSSFWLIAFPVVGDLLTYPGVIAISRSEFWGVGFMTGSIHLHLQLYFALSESGSIVKY